MVLMLRSGLWFINGSLFVFEQLFDMHLVQATETRNGVIGIRLLLHGDRSTLPIDDREW